MMRDLVLPNVKQEFYPLGGGLDLLTPAIAFKPGRCIDVQNYEPEISGGYRRIDGHERFDGRPSPSLAAYFVLTVDTPGNLAVGNTVTNLAVTATAKVLSITGSSVVLGRMTGTAFASGVALYVAAVFKATTTAAADISPSQSLDADYTLLAANDLRGDIAAVPGTGQIRGVWVYKDMIYAFRDNAGLTANVMWQATGAG